MSNTTVQPKLISVIMPAFNSASYISESINSVLSQDYANIELIIINDGSTDNTASIIKECLDNYEQTDSKRFKVQYVETVNQGVSAARNHAIKIANGDWIAFCDADDVWFPSKISNQLRQLNGCSWSYTDSYYMGEDYAENTRRSDLSSLPCGHIFEQLITENIITTSSVLVRKSILLECGGFDESLEALEDWQLWLTIASKYEISLIVEPMLNYRVYSGSTSRKARKMLPLHISVITSTFAGLPQTPHNNKMKVIALQKAYLICSYIAEQSKDFVFAFKCSLKAWMLKPSSFLLNKRLLACAVRVFLH